MCTIRALSSGEDLFDFLFMAQSSEKVGPSQKDGASQKRQGFGISTVSPLANLAWCRDQALVAMPLPRVTVKRHVSLLQRRRLGRETFTQGLKDHFRTRGRRQRLAAARG